MGQLENKRVFEHTMAMIKKTGKLKDAVRESIASQYVSIEEEAMDESISNLKELPNLRKYEEDAKVIVSKKRTMEAAGAYKGMKTVVHNFASATTPGGGVTRGSSAQEEALCRVSTLYASLNTSLPWEMFYNPHRKEGNPIHNGDLIYTPKVVVFKTDTSKPEMMKEEDWYEVDVVTLAAPNLRPKPSNAFNASDGNKKVKVSNAELLKIHKRRLRRLLDEAAKNNAEVVILGAFGCGAFQNNPEVVAKAAMEVVEEYRRAFKVIEFAVYCSGEDTANYRMFDLAMKKYSR